MFSIVNLNKVEKMKARTGLECKTYGQYRPPFNRLPQQTEDSLA